MDRIIVFDTQILVASWKGVLSRAGRYAGSKLAGCRRALAEWRAEHRRRAAFEDLNDHILRDIGLTRAAVREIGDETPETIETRKPERRNPIEKP